MAGKGIGGHQIPRMESDDWLTPPDILEALGPFDLDPCAAVGQPWRTAAREYTKIDDGLSLPWDGLVWLNPPYGRIAERWLERLSVHGNGIALIFARVETAMFTRYVWGAANGVLFLRTRLTFRRLDGIPASANSGAPSCLVGYGTEAMQRICESGLKGVLIQKWRTV